MSGWHRPFSNKVIRSGAFDKIEVQSMGWVSTALEVETRSFEARHLCAAIPTTTKCHLGRI